MPYSPKNRRKARDHVDDLRAKTVCIICGKQPVEWHRKEHEQDGNLRIAHLAALGFPIERIDEEIAKCDALCRRCHMYADGRINNLKYQSFDLDEEVRKAKADATERDN